MASNQKGKRCPVSCCRQVDVFHFIESPIYMGKIVIPELGQLCKTISSFHEIDIESQKEYG